MASDHKAGDFLAISRSLQDECEQATREALPGLGEKAPKCHAEFLQLLALADQLASCWWGCPGTEDAHVLHRLLGRCVSNSAAALRLIHLGHYDEALLLARGIGEVANLLWLFATDPSQLARWRDLDAKDRWAQFRPKKVRDALKTRNVPIPIAHEDYEALSGVAAHVGPTTAPQVYGPGERPVLFGRFHATGFIASLNELAGAMATVVAAAAKLIDPLPPAQQKVILERAVSTLRSVGGVRLTGVLAKKFAT